MQINKNNKRKIVLIVTLVAVCAAGIVYSAYALKIPPFAQRDNRTINLDKPTEEEVQAGIDIKNKSNGDNSQTGSDPALPPKEITDSSNKSVNVAITAANIEGSTLRIRTLIQYVTSTGNCTLTLTGPQQKIYSATANVQALPSSSTCRGFDVPLSDISSGEWKIELNFVDNNIIGSSSSKALIP